MRNAGEGVEKKATPPTPPVLVEMHTGAALWRKVNRKLKIELPYDPAIPLTHIYLEKTIIPKDTGTPKFTAALFSRTWKDMEAM